jgi:uncharacterized protein YbcI
MEVEARQDGQPESGRTDLSAISNSMVAIYKEQFGRGPTRVKSSYADANTLICTLENSLTPVERSMLALGEQQRVEETRLFFQRATRTMFTGAVEKITGRRVRGFVSGTDAEKDISTEVFYLEPAGDTLES